MSVVRSGNQAKTITCLQQRFRYVLGIAVLLQALLVASPVAAQCSASLNVSQVDDSTVHFSLSGSGSCPNVGDDQTKVELFMRQIIDGVPLADIPYIPERDCQSSPCTKQYDQVFSCPPDNMTWELMVTCWKAGASGCTTDTAGTARQTISAPLSAEIVRSAAVLLAD